MLTAAIAACAVACASFDYAFTRAWKQSRGAGRAMDQSDRVAICRKILKHSDSMEDLLNNWTTRRDRRGVEWFVARLMFGRDSTDSLRGDPEFEQCVREMSEHEGGDRACDADGDHVAAPSFLRVRPTRYGSGVYYIAQRAIRTRATVLLRRAGFSEMRHGGVRYWQGGGGGGGKPLAVFLHGIGVGLYPYIPLLAELSETLEVIAIEFDHLTLSGRETMTNVEAADAVRELLRGREAVLVGHSYGTVIAATVNKRCPELVSGLVLMAPSCFLMYRGEIQSRFFDSGAPMSQRVLGRNPTIHAAIHSGTVWPQGEMWPEDVADKRWLVVLAESDQLIPFDRTKKHVEEHFRLARGERELVCVPGKHGSCFSSERAAVVRRVRDMFGRAR